MSQPYSKFSLDELILRDHLAMDRTILANERTLLSYVRTAIMLLVSGVTIIKLFSTDHWLQIIGISLVPVSIFVAGMGLVRYRAMQRAIEMIGAVTPEDIEAARERGADEV